ncbi:inx [Lepeophtheirus salmonis]|uniref:Innexin n=1 Tax=Lepeophtheirus salmonis TaxID=72036 RepID=A0A7R8CM21_LEPSM|nr:inx [Lepeophtheirus salmonis]CAF2860484.1 inx [Lepeophtheirus salmonis]
MAGVGSNIVLISTVIGFVGYFKTRDQGKAYIDDLPFRLHYTFTTAFLFLGSVVVGLQDLVGKNIDCDSIYPGIGTGVHHGTRSCIQTYDAYGRKTWETSRGEPCFRTIDYYSWIPYALFLKGCLFYIPRLLWLSWEEGVMNTFSEGVRYGTKVENDEYMGHIRYGWGYVFAQTLNFLNVIGAFLFTDYFFHGQFKNLGRAWLMNSNKSNDVLLALFPRMTTCIFEQYGSGGVVRAKTISGSFRGINLLLVLFMSLKSMRVRNLYMMRAVLNSRKVTKWGNANAEKELNQSIRKMSLGQFLFLYLLGRNVDRPTYESIVIFYSKSLKREDHYVSLETLEQNSRLSSTVVQG